MHNYKELNVWKKSIHLAVDVYLLTTQFPPEEKFGLVSQIRRCAVSVPSNIAEGAGRKSNKEFSHFLSISYGSLCEMDTQMIISKELEYLGIGDFEKLGEKIDELQKMIFTLLNKF